MTATFNIDGWPYRIEFTGAIEVARMDSGDVAVRVASEGAVVKSIELDEVEIARQSEVLRDMMREENLARLVYTQMSANYAKSQMGRMGGCAIRAGYD